MIDNLNQLLPDLPPMSDDMRLDMHRKYVTPYLFYRKHRTYIDCYCTSCLKRTRLDLDGEIVTPQDECRLDIARSIKQGSIVTCPECGRQVTARSEGIGRQKLTERYCLCCFYDLGDKVYAVCGVLTGGFDAGDIDDLSRFYGGSRWDPYYAVEYTPRISRIAYYNYYLGFEFAVGIFEPYIYRPYGRDYFDAYNPEVLQGSFLRHILPARYLTDKSGQHYNGAYPLLYLMYAVRYPAVEMLIKSGGANIVEEIIDNNRAHKSTINLTGTTAAEVFCTDSNDAAVIRRTMQSGVKVNIDILQIYKRLKSMGKKQRRKYKLDDAIDFYSAVNYHYSDCLTMLKSTQLTPTKFVNYLKKQKSRGNSPFNYLVRDYKDYIQECKQLGYDITDDQIRRPSNLGDAHLRTSQAVTVIEQEIQERKEAQKTSKYISEYYSNYVNKYEYADNKYCIIVPKSGTEIVTEGKRQHHCVAGYADRHITGKLAILFMRFVDYPSAPLYTIEMSGNMLIQIRGDHNAAPTDEARKFVDKWLKWVALPDDRKHPKDKTA